MCVCIGIIAANTLCSGVGSQYTVRGSCERTHSGNLISVIHVRPVNYARTRSPAWHTCNCLRIHLSATGSALVRTFWQQSSYNYRSVTHTYLIDVAINSYQYCSVRTRGKRDAHFDLVRPINNTHTMLRNMPRYWGPVTRYAYTHTLSGNLRKIYRSTDPRVSNVRPKAQWSCDCFFTCHFINCAYHMILVLYFLYCGDIRSSHEFRPCLNTTHQIIIIDFVIVICLHAVIACTCLMAISRTRVLRSVWTCVIFYVPILFIMYFLDFYFRHSEDK